MKKFSWRQVWPTARTLAIAPPFLWLTLFLLVPFFLVLKISFADLKFGIPPYTALTEIKDQTLSSGAVLEQLEMPPGIGVSGLESDGADIFYCGGGASGKVRAVRRPKQ